MGNIFAQEFNNLKVIITKCKEDPTFSLQFHNYLLNLVSPVFKSIAGKYSRNVEYQVMFEECVNDIFMYVLNHEDAVYTNFNSYIRKRFEFYFINKLISYNRYKNRALVNVDELETNNEVEPVKKTRGEPRYVGESFAEIMILMEEKSNSFDFTEKMIITYFYKGYNFNEISDLIGYSYGKTKNTFEDVITKLKNFYFKKSEKEKK